MRIVGNVDGKLGEGILGWACTPDMPDNRLWVELLVDDCVLGIARAENYHHDATAYGDGCYGFWLPLPSAVRDMDSVAQVRIANTAHTLEPSVLLDKVLQKMPLLGSVSNDLALTLSGWAADAAEPKRILQVSAWLNGKKKAEVAAREARFRPVCSNGHGFSLSLPLELADGREHLVHVQDEEKRELPGSPVMVCALPEGLVEWFALRKALSATDRKFFAAMLANYESWLPRCLRLDMYEVWRDCFPVPPCAMPANGRVGLVDARTVTLASLKIAAAAHDALLWHSGERLHPSAIGLMFKTLQESEALLIYADAEIRTADGALRPLCKSAWDIYSFCCTDNLGPMLVRSNLIPADGDSSRTELILLAHERNGIRHLPQFLSETDEISMPVDPERTSVLNDWLQRREQHLSVEPLAEAPHVYRLRVNRNDFPMVSVLIPTRNSTALLRACLTSLNTTDYEAVEILILDNGSTDADTAALFRQAKMGRVCRFPVRVVPCAGPFNYAAINNMGAREARGELLCLLNNDTEVVSSDWLQQMAGLLLSDPGQKVGAVGAKLLWPNELVQHAGVVTGTHGLAAHIGNQWLRDAAGYMDMNRVTRQVSAVTAACLLTPRALFLEYGGFDAVRFPVAFNDVDYCLRLHEAGHRIVWTPNATLMHHESASRGHDVTPAQKHRADMELHHFRSLWGRRTDPFYNPNLSLSTVLEPYAGLAFPPRSRSAR